MNPLFMLVKRGDDEPELVNDENVALFDVDQIVGNQDDSHERDHISS